MTTPTAALVEEAETHTTCDKCGAAIVKYSDFTGLLPTEDGMRSHTPLVCERTQELRRAEAERDELRATVTRLNRRAQTAEAGVRDNVEASKAAGKSMGRTLANAAAAMNLRRAEKAEAERDAQHAEVLRLTGERDAAREGWQQEVERRLKASGDLMRLAWDLHAVIDKQNALGFGLGCLLTNSREETEWQVEETRTLRKEVRELSERLAGMPIPEDDDPAGKHLMSLINRRRELYQRVDELTATRDLLNEENARLQARVATLELLRRGGK